MVGFPFAFPSKRVPAPKKVAHSWIITGTAKKLQDLRAHEDEEDEQHQAGHPADELQRHVHLDNAHAKRVGGKR